MAFSILAWDRRTHQRSKDWPKFLYLRSVSWHLESSTNGRPLQFSFTKTSFRDADLFIFPDLLQTTVCILLPFFTCLCSDFRLVLWLVYEVVPLRLIFPTDHSYLVASARWSSASSNDPHRSSHRRFGLVQGNSKLSDGGKDDAHEITIGRVNEGHKNGCLHPMSDLMSPRLSFVDTVLIMTSALFDFQSFNLPLNHRH